MRDRNKNIIGLALLVALIGSCKLDGRRQTYAQVGADGQGLREAFNADAGKVRLLVLVAPT